jgi:hypothetical protein
MKMQPAVPGFLDIDITIYGELRGEYAESL